VAHWFAARFGQPTAAQGLAWPAITRGKNLLLAAPTGAGKTLAALLPIIDHLLRRPTASSVRCLYLAPLKALANDLRRNLRAHLHRLYPFFPEAPTPLRLGLRTGDTPASERRRQQRRPPDILLTTPESLAVLLSQASAADLFRETSWCVVDEVHALAGNKRGADLALSLERLAELTGDRFRRIGLSATCAPLDEAARFLMGTGRPCTIAEVTETSRLALSVEPLADDGRFLDQLVARLEPELRTNRTTLVFTNTRGLAERLAWTLRRRFPDWDADIGVHHSALAAARRRVLERRLRQGRLRVVVTTTSLELGIDIGAVDGVVLVHPPGQVIRLLQRVGRSGHAPDGLRRGLVLTSNGAELLEAAVTQAACGEGTVPPQQERLQVPLCPLDVLCQQLLGMAAQRPWSPDDAFALVRRAYPYRHLTRGDFDACVDYLSGRHRDGRDWLPARLRWDGEKFAILDARTARILRRNIGTILGEARRTVLLAPQTSVNDGSPTPLGDLDEAFADRLQPGDRFVLDGRCLEVQSMSGPALLTHEVVGRPRVPRWGADGWGLSADLARRLYLLRVQAAEALRDRPEALHRLLRRDYGLGERAARILCAFFERQECVSEIPDDAVCLVEVIGGGATSDYYVHTRLSRPGNDALSRVAALRLARDLGRTVTSVVADLGFALLASPPLSADDLRQALSTRDFESDLDRAIRDSTSLRERFRRAAFTALMLLRHPLGARRKVGGQDWAERRLFEKVVAADPEFILLRQAAREVREECCDVRAALEYLMDLERRPLRFRRLATPSPFVESWTQLAPGAVASAESPTEALERLHAELLGAGSL
jgi:ATP-dependent Lhr-like helicase